MPGNDAVARIDLGELVELDVFRLCLSDFNRRFKMAGLGDARDQSPGGQLLAFLQRVGEVAQALQHAVNTRANLERFDLMPLQFQLAPQLGQLGFLRGNQRRPHRPRS